MEVSLRSSQAVHAASAYIRTGDRRCWLDAVGEGVTGFALGDEVFGRGSGTYADYAIAPVKTIAHIPDGVTFEQAATLHVGGETAWVALFDAANLEAGQRLLILGGAGGVGGLGVKLGHWKGETVIATAL